MNALRIKLKWLSVMTIALFCLVSCDKIKKPYRVEEKVIACDTPSFPALNNVLQKYLLEDYTGHTCTNCPRAHKIAHDLIVQMGDTLVVMAIHAGDNARPEEGAENCSFTADYRTEAGNDYVREFTITAYPNGMINRMRINGNRTVMYSNWKKTLDTITRKTPLMAIQIMTEENSESTCIFVKTSLLSIISGKLRLCVFVTENGIISPQKDAATVKCDYEHNHVLRAAIAPIWGDDLNITAKDESLIKGYSVDFKDKVWKKENCHIVAFVYDLDTQEILQVEEIKLVEK